MSTTLSVTTVLDALRQDPRNSSEKDLAVALLRVWEGLSPFVSLKDRASAGERLLDLSFPDWRQRALVQMAMGVLEMADGFRATSVRLKDLSKDEPEDEPDPLAVDLSAAMEEWDPVKPRLRVWSQKRPGGLPETD